MEKTIAIQKDVSLCSSLYKGTKESMLRTNLPCSGEVCGFNVSSATMRKMQHSQMPFCDVVNNLLCVTGYDIPSFPLLIGNQMCAFCEREIHMHLLGEFCAKLFYNLGSLSPHSCTYVEYPRVLDVFPHLTVRSKWEFQMGVSDTQRDSNPLEMFTFSFYCSQQLVGPELEPFHCGEIWSLTSAVCSCYC